MRRITIAVAATIAGSLAISLAAAGEQGTRRGIRHHRGSTGVLYPYLAADPAVRGGYIMNGNFDWRRIGEHRPWYAHGYNSDCVAWSHDAYHYACDPNYRY